MPATQDPVSQSIVAVVLLGVLLLLTLEKAHRLLVILAAVALLWLVTYLTPYRLISFEEAQRALDLNVILLLAAMMALVGVLKTTGVFGWAAARLVSSARGIPALLQSRVIWFTGVLSAFIDNVTTVLFMYPMVARMAAATGVATVPFILPMIVASNIGGAATLIGDPPNILIGSSAGLSFLDFIVTLTMPVLWMMVLAAAVSRRYYRKLLLQPSPGPSPATLNDSAGITDPLLLKWGLGIAALVLVGFLTHSVTGMPAAVPAVVGATALLVVQDILYLRRRPSGPTHEERTHGILAIIEREIEWPTLAFFAFLFVAVGAAVGTGLIDTLAGGLIELIESARSALDLSETGTLLFASLLLLWASGILSAVIDNIPYVAVAIPLVARLSGSLSGEVQVLWWALALGAALGGNGTAIGASANVTVIGLADRAGTRISFRDFTRFGATITGLTLLVSSAFLASYIWLGPRLTQIGGFTGLAGYGLWRAMRGRP